MSASTTPLPAERGRLLPGKGVMSTIAVVLSALVALVLALLLWAALSGWSWTGPPAWLTEWTTWLVSALAAVFAPLVLKDLASALNRLGRG